MEIGKPKDNLTINISTITILKVLAVFLLLWFLFLIRGVLAVVFISVILASAFDSSVDWLQKRKIPRSLGILLIYILLFGLLSVSVALLIEPLQEQWRELTTSPPVGLGWLTENLQFFWHNLNEMGLMEKLEGLISSGSISNAISGFFSKIGSAASGLFSLVFILVLTFYMVVEENSMKKVIWSITPSSYQPYVMQLINRIQRKIGTWLKAQLVLGLIVGLLTMVGLLIIGNKYYLVLAIIAGIFEIVPVIGPVFAGIVAVLLTLATYGWGKAVMVLILAVLVQQIENNLLVPKIMQKALGLNPIVSLIVLLIGAQLGGIVGALLAIPVATAVKVATEDFFKEKEV